MKLLKPSGADDKTLFRNYLLVILIGYLVSAALVFAGLYLLIEVDGALAVIFGTVLIVLSAVAFIYYFVYLEVNYKRFKSILVKRNEEKITSPLNKPRRWAVAVCMKFIDGNMLATLTGITLTKEGIIMAKELIPYYEISEIRKTYIDHMKQWFLAVGKEPFGDERWTGYLVSAVDGLESFLERETGRFIDQKECEKIQNEIDEINATETRWGKNRLRMLQMIGYVTAVMVLAIGIPVLLILRFPALKDSASVIAVVMSVPATQKIPHMFPRTLKTSYTINKQLFVYNRGRKSFTFYWASVERIDVNKSVIVFTFKAQYKEADEVLASQSARYSKRLYDTIIEYNTKYALGLVVYRREFR